ncbi:DUF4810 domain-containing protein [Roseateles depolymerans]|uniref:Lipoprotein n=1 Tax=Roseateles depolymerans TaxID=76731 RepID=A0A0U3N8P5_9BURK|nr:DUF4810 domain-containing protein [Roseateles depolymerans]ALV04928.1 Lipoprotein [Roseateles depolymerans]REG15060.1 hypothetical protein DES44_3565 [Roseateles depolymerans]
MMKTPMIGQTAGRRGALLVTTVLCGLFTACAQPPKPLYQWSGYQSNLYDYFKTSGANAGEQIDKLEAQLVKNKAANEASPPGLHGHLALLYAKVGNDNAAKAHLEAERALFPESAAYVDLLLKRRAAASMPAAGASAPTASTATPATAAAPVAAAK